MPIEIKELHIKVSVTPPPQPNATPSPQQPQSGNGGVAGGDKEAVVAECVEQVLQILQQKNER